MRIHQRQTALALVVLTGLFSAPVWGDGQGASDWSLTGGFQLGFRAVDVEGRQEKYEEDFNLQDGPRLFTFNLDLAPPKELRQYFDHVELSMNNIGGDPFQSLRFAIEKYGQFSLKWEQRTSTYFYEDVILPPELASPELANVGDLHSFDFDRVRDTASLTLWMTESARLDVGFDRYTKKGTSTTTYDVQRDEFEFDRPIDESLDEYRASFSYDWKKATLVVREHIREYENSVEAFLPGASAGENREDATVLDYFFLGEPYNLSSYGHVASLVARPSDRLLVRLEASREDFELELEGGERSQGVDFLGRPFVTDSSGTAEVDRDLSALDVSVAYQVTDRIALVVDASSKSLEQNGALAQDGDVTRTEFEIDTTGAELAVQMETINDLTFTAGVRDESRDVLDDVGEERRTTDQTGVFALVGWHPSRRISLTARFDSSSFDNPFTTASPSDRESLRLRARYARPLGFSLSAMYHLDTLDNTGSGWDADIEHLSLRAGYRFALLSMSLGYSAVTSDREVDQTVVTLPGFGGGVALFLPIAYRADTEVVDARFSWAVSPRLKIGGDVRLYENQGSFPLAREQARLYSEFGFGKGYVAHIGLRQIDYDEGLNNFDDYRADIAELALGYRWR